MDAGGEDAELEQIVDRAARLFGELGFDGTSLGLIAEAAGVDARTLTALVGGKPELYRTVIVRARAAERSAMAASAAAFTPTRQGMDDVLDAYLDFYAANPHLVALWLHRGIGDAADAGAADVEEIYLRPGFTNIANAVRDFAPAGIDVDHIVWTVTWAVLGFLGIGMMHSAPDRPHIRGHQITPADLEDFRTYLHQLVARLLPLPDAP